MADWRLGAQVIEPANNASAMPLVLALRDADAIDGPLTFFYAESAHWNQLRAFSDRSSRRRFLDSSPSWVPVELRSHLREALNRRRTFLAVFDRQSEDAQDPIRLSPKPPPMLDAATAHAVSAFLHWTVIALMRLHRHWGPFEGLAEVQDAAEAASVFLRGDGHLPKELSGEGDEA
jgi:hypothetical protein